MDIRLSRNEEWRLPDTPGLYEEPELPTFAAAIGTVDRIGAKFVCKRNAFCIFLRDHSFLFLIRSIKWPF